MTAPTWYATTSSGAITGKAASLDGTVVSGGIAIAGSIAAQVGSWSTIVSGGVVAGTPPGIDFAQNTAATSLAAGLAITCTGNSPVSATYKADPVTIASMAKVQEVIAATTYFPGGAFATWTLKDAAGAQISVTTTQFTAIYLALCAFASACDAIIGGSSISLPSSSATIA